MATPIRIKRSAVPGKRPQVTDLQVGELALNTYDAEIVTLRDRFSQTGISTEVVRLGAGATVTNVIYVTKDGNDNNTGLKLGDAKATIKSAVGIATTGDVIRVSAGSYVENNPIDIPPQVSIVGDSLREVSVTPQNAGEDLFYVAPGNYLSELSFTGSMDSGKAIVAFNPNKRRYSAQSPYISNCTNFIQNSIGMKIDGDHVIGPFKSMVTDSYTQYNSNGIGVSITNNGYAQLVSIFTINPDISIFTGTGGQCDLTNSNSSFGNFGLVAVGLGSTQFTGIVSNTNTANEIITSTVADNQDTVVCANVRDDSDGNNTIPFTGAVRRPFDGQALYFKIDLDNYPDTQGSGRITSPLQQLRSVSLIEGADASGYSAFDPPSVLIRDNDGEVEPKGPQGVIAEATATVSPTGNITAITVVAQGRNYLPTQNIVVDIEGETGIATAVMEPIYYTVESATKTENVSGISTLTFNEFIPYELFPDDPFTLQRISRVLTSSHSFEYVGTGTDINIATPLQGAIPIKENEIVAKDGAQIPFTSTCLLYTSDAADE